MCCVAVHQDFLGAKQIEQLCQNEVGSIQMRLAAQYVVQVHESASWRCVAAMLVVVVEKELLDPPVKFIVGVDKLTD